MPAHFINKKMTTIVCEDCGHISYRFLGSLVHYFLGRRGNGPSEIESCSRCNGESDRMWKK